MPFQVVYTSSASRKMGPEDLSEILQEARERNERLGVTGMLLYNDGNFLQVLEGDEATVRDLYERIEGDERHHGIITLMDREADARDFDDWTMGFRHLGTLDSEDLPEGYTRFMQGRAPEGRSQSDADAPSHAYQALLHFRDMDHGDQHIR